MKGSLSIEMTKGGKQLVRATHDDEATSRLNTLHKTS